MRRQFAEYDTRSLNSDLKKLLAVLKEGKGGEEIFSTWLSEIDFKLLPKKIQEPGRGRIVTSKEKTDSANPENKPNDNQSLKSFISNLRTAEKYNVEDVHYFIHAPIPTFLLITLRNQY